MLHKRGSHSGPVSGAGSLERLEGKYAASASPGYSNGE